MNLRRTDSNARAEESSLVLNRFTENLELAMMSKLILLVEDNPDDAKLTLRAFKRNNMLNPIEVAQDGIEALDFLFARGAHAGRGL